MRRSVLLNYPSVQSSRSAAEFHLSWWQRTAASQLILKMTATPLPIAPRTSSGFLKPVFSALQRRAIKASLLFGSVFLAALVAICWQMYHLLPTATRQDVLSVAGFSTALLIAFSGFRWRRRHSLGRVIFVKQHVSGPQRSWPSSRSGRQGDLSSATNPRSRTQP